jgi:hypothetical protein
VRNGRMYRVERLFDSHNVSVPVRTTRGNGWGHLGLEVFR